jgi:hypothetical protein
MISEASGSVGEIWEGNPNWTIRFGSPLDVD